MSELDEAILRARAEAAKRGAEAASAAEARQAARQQAAPAHAEAHARVTAAAEDFWPRAELCDGPRDEHGIKIGTHGHHSIYVGSGGMLLIGMPAFTISGFHAGGFRELQPEDVDADLAGRLIRAMGSWLADAKPGRVPKRPRDKSWILVHLLAAAILIAAAAIAYPETMATVGAYVVLAVVVVLALIGIAIAFS